MEPVPPIEVLFNLLLLGTALPAAGAGLSWLVSGVLKSAGRVPVAPRPAAGRPASAPRRRARAPRRLPRRVVPPGGLPAALGALAEDSRQTAATRLEAAEVLCRWNPAEAGPRLGATALSERVDPRIRIALLRLIGEFGGARAVSVLLCALESSDISVIIAAESGLRAMAARGPVFALAAVRGLGRSVADAGHGGRLLPALRVLIEIARANRGFFVTREAGRVLLGVLSREARGEGVPEECAATALEALAELDPEAALGVSRAAASSRSDLLRYKGVLALGLIGGKGCIKELGFVAAHDWIGRIRSAAIDSAMRISERLPRSAPSLP